MIQIKVAPHDGDTYILLESVRIIVRGHFIFIEEGFVFDGASIPRIFWSIIGGNFQPEFLAPSLVHDYLCVTGNVERKEADKIFRELLLMNDVPEFRAALMYRAVRVWSIFS